ncbi:MAG: nucleoside deaminase [Candidatus Omnitrophota bacterium]|nr:MAG: nucleoside deaminase [Candidatus Omnitrophota bacterium]
MGKPEYYMKRAISEARKNLKTMEGGPFGACIVKNGSILAISRNTVLKEDATCHAEINAIRAASKKIRSFDLSGSIIYSTTEPCPMCFSAIHWARIGTVVYGTTIKDVERAGFNELKINGSLLKALGKSKVTLKKTHLIDECRKLIYDWQKLENKRLY